MLPLRPLSLVKVWFFLIFHLVAYCATGIEFTTNDLKDINTIANGDSIIAILVTDDSVE